MDLEAAIDGDLVVTCLTEFEALNINSTLDVNGDVYFANILDVALGLKVNGVIKSMDLTVLNTVTVLIEAMVADAILANEIPMLPTHSHIDYWQ